MASSESRTVDPRLFRDTISAGDRNVISQLLRHAETELKGYQTEISRLKTVIYSLESKRDGLKKNVERYQSLLSPIRRMPPEILLSIFKFVCDENELHHRDCPPNSVVLSMVCGGWRDLAISTPTLWSNLEIHFTKSRYRYLHNWTKIFMKRSKQSPLDLSLYLPALHLTQKSLRPLDTLVRHSDRWRDVSIFLFPPFFPSQSFAPAQSKLSMLQSIQLKDDSEESSDLKISPIHFLNVTPSLHTLRLSPTLLELEDLLLPWAQIRTLSLYDAYSARALPFLQKCSNLVELELSHVGEGDDFEGHILLNTLSSLVVRSVSGPEDVDDILTYTTLPALTHLVIEGDSDEGEFAWREWDTDALTDFVDRSACHITSLHLSRAPIDDEQVLSLLKRMPELECLHLEDAPNVDDRVVTPDLLEGLVVEPGCSSLTYPTTQPLVPRLTELKLVTPEDWENWYDGDTMQKAFLKMLSSRWFSEDAVPRDGLARLLTVEIVVSTEETLENFEPLRCFKDAGMLLEIRRAHEDDSSDSEPED